MKNAEIADIFNKIADLLEIKGENPFRIRAYRSAAFTVNSLGRDVSSMSSAELLKIPHIGKDLSAKIEEYVKEGKIGAYEELTAVMPEGLISLLHVPGLGPKTVNTLYEKYRVDDLDRLEELARTGKLRTVPGIREKTEKNILKGIEMLRRSSLRAPLGRVLPVANEIVSYLSANAPIAGIDIAGSIRRWKETIRDIDIISTSKDPESVMKVFTRMPDVREVLLKGPTKSSIVRKEGFQVDLRVVDEDSYGSALAYFTGSKGHNIRLRERASKEGMKINEYGIYREKDGRKLGGRREADIYDILGLQYVPPELREDTGEVEAAAARALPELIEAGDIKGDLHVHSDWSDGNLSLEDIVKSAREKGYEYVAVTDHSRGLGVARGLKEERILEQRKMVDALNRKRKNFRLLSGVECNIRSDGALDVEEEILKKLDFVVASVHSGFKQPKEQITRRIITAMKNPYVSVIAHPTGRLLGERDAYEVDIEAVLNAAAETETALEINAYPLRLDLAPPYVRMAKAMKAPLVISTDAHNTGQFENMIFGVSTARRGWLEKKDVLNTLGCRSLVKQLRHLKR